MHTCDDTGDYFWRDPLPPWNASMGPQQSTQVIGRFDAFSSGKCTPRNPRTVIAKCTRWCLTFTARNPRPMSATRGSSGACRYKITNVTIAGILSLESESRFCTRVSRTLEPDSLLRVEKGNSARVTWTAFGDWKEYSRFVLSRRINVHLRNLRKDSYTVKISVRIRSQVL